MWFVFYKNFSFSINFKCFNSIRLIMPRRTGYSGYSRRTRIALAATFFLSIVLGALTPVLKESIYNLLERRPYGGIVDSDVSDVDSDVGIFYPDIRVVDP